MDFEARMGLMGQRDFSEQPVQLERQALLALLVQLAIQESLAWQADLEVMVHRDLVVRQE
jgi:hypothetical protein